MPRFFDDDTFLTDEELQALETSRPSAPGAGMGNEIAPKPMIPGDWASLVGDISGSILPLPRIEPGPTGIRGPELDIQQNPLSVMPGIGAIKPRQGITQAPEPQGILKTFANSLIGRAATVPGKLFDFSVSSLGKLTADELNTRREMLRKLRPDSQMLDDLEGMAGLAQEVGSVYANQMSEWDSWSQKNFPRKSPSLMQIIDNPDRTWDDAGQMIAQGLGETLPSMALMIAGGWAGYTGNAAKDFTLQWAMSSLVETPEIYQDIFEKTGQMRPGVAGGFGIVAGLVETPFFWSVNSRLRRIFGKDVAAQIAQRATTEGAFSLIAKQALKDMAMEASEEGIQTYLEKAAVEWVDSRFPALSRENKYEIVQAMLIGGLMGGMVGLGTGVVEEANRNPSTALENVVRSRVVPGFVVAEDEIIRDTGMLPPPPPPPDQAREVPPGVTSLAEGQPALPAPRPPRVPSPGGPPIQGGMDPASIIADPTLSAQEKIDALKGIFPSPETTQTQEVPNAQVLQPEEIQPAQEEVAAPEERPPEVQVEEVVPAPVSEESIVPEGPEVPEPETIVPPSSINIMGVDSKVSESPESTPGRTPGERLSSVLADRIKSSEGPMDWRKLFAFADSVYGGTQAEGKYTPKDAYDALELAVNKIVLDDPGKYSPDGTLSEAKKKLDSLRALVEKIPTQTKRTEEQQEFQQFSTPPTLGFVANWLANIKAGETVLEPSAGTGSLAAFAKAEGAKVAVNELSRRRLDLLKTLPFDSFTMENAEHIDAMKALSGIKPSVIIMNPPFSATAGRVPGQRDTAVGMQHIAAALSKLEPGGRLIAIVGEGQGTDSKKLKPQWDAIMKKYTVLADVGIDGQEYRKYGTTFGNRVLVIDKTGPTPSGQTIRAEVKSLDEFFQTDSMKFPALMEGIRNARTTESSRPKTPGEKTPTPSLPPGPAPSAGNQPTGVGAPNVGAISQPVSAPSGQGAGNNPPVSVPTAQNGGRPGAGGSAIQTGIPGNKEPGGRGPSAPSVAPGQTAGVTVPPGGPEQPGGRGQIRQPGGETVPSGTTEPIPGLTVESVLRETAPVEVESTFVNYTPKRLKIEGAKVHPSPLSETAAMASVNPPPVKYSPSLPKSIIENGDLSLPQLENVVYAGQAHSVVGSDGIRHGYMIGDGTGVGKGRQIAGIILDNFNQGRKKAIWITKNNKLKKEAIRDLRALGFAKEDLFDLDSYDPVTRKTGVMFLTYGKLRSASKAKEGQPSIKRTDQVMQWTGQDFDGVMVFDESHMMGNAIDQKMSGGMTKKATKTGASGLELQGGLPNARVVYSSATAATEVSNLAYASRLGLWGPGTAFPTRQDFLQQIGAGGLAAMEIVARDAKAMGVYLSRSLSWDGVSYEQLNHPLTDEQRDTYNRLARAWQSVLGNVDDVLESTGGKNSRWAKAAAQSAFWSSQQRFFQQVITGMSLPSVFKSMDEKLKAGESIVVQLVNTNEASLDRQMSRSEGEEDEDSQVEMLDLSPREILVEYLRNSFPTTLYQEVEDAEGNKSWQPVVDSEGNVVEDPEAIRKRDELIEVVGALPVPENPLDQIVNYFGHEKVAEVTGRGRRRIEKDGKQILQNRTPAMVDAEIVDFEEGKKRILIFSKAGGTGKSFHSSRDFKNQQRRNHYLIQAGWSANEVIQGYGRSHRTNQVIPPNFVMPTTDLSGQKRFTSTVARRLGELGAITKGERKSEGSGFFKEFDNLENQYSMDAVQELVGDIMGGNIPWFPAEDLKEKMGLDLRRENDSRNRRSSNDLSVQRFLNRILALEYEDQNRMFDAFFERFMNNIDRAKRAGNYDEGLQTVRALEINKVEERTVHTTPTGAETKLLALDVVTKTKTVPFTTVSGENFRVFRNNKSERVWAFDMQNQVTRTDRKTGRSMVLFRAVSPSGTSSFETQENLSEKFTQAKDFEEGKTWWNERLKEVPKTQTDRTYMITGALLPIYDRLPAHPVEIVRVQTKEGEYLGRIIPEDQLSDVMKNLGVTMGEEVTGKTPQNMTPAEIFSAIISDGAIVRLANGWRMKRVKLSGQDRIEIEGPTYYQSQMAKQMGLFSETVNYKTRWFIPTDPTAGPQVMTRVMENRPAVEIEGTKTNRREPPAFSAEYLVAKWASRGLRGAWNWARQVAGNIPLGEFIQKAKRLFPKIGGRTIELLNDALRSLGRRGGMPDLGTVDGAVRAFLGFAEKVVSPIAHMDFLLRNFPTVEKFVRRMYEDWGKFTQDYTTRVKEILQDLPESEYGNVVDILEGKESPGASPKAKSAAQSLKVVFSELWGKLREVSPWMGRIKEYWPHYRDVDTESDMTPEEQEEFYRKLDEAAPKEKRIDPDTKFRSTLKRRTSGGWEYSINIPKVMAAYIKGAGKRIFLGPVSDFIRKSEIEDEIRLKQADLRKLQGNSDPRAQSQAQALTAEIKALRKKSRVLAAAKVIPGSEKMETWRRDLLHAAIMLDYGSYSPIERWLFSTKRDVAIARNRMHMLTGLAARALFLFNFSSALTNLSQQSFIMGDHGYIPYSTGLVKTIFRSEGWDSPFKNGAIEDDTLFTQYTGEESQKEGVWKTLWGDYIKNPMRGTERINRLVAYHAGVTALEMDRAKAHRSMPTSEEAKEAGLKSIRSSQFDYSKANRSYASRTIFSPLFFLGSFPIHILEKAVRLLGSQGFSGALKFSVRAGIPLALVYVLGRALGYDLERKVNPVDQPWAWPLPLLVGGVVNRGLQLAQLMSNNKEINAELEKARNRAKMLSWTEGGDNPPFMVGAAEDVYDVAKEGVTQTLGTAPRGGGKRMIRTGGSIASKVVPGGLAISKLAKSVDRLAGTGILGKPEKTTVGQEIMKNLGIQTVESADARMLEKYKRMFPKEPQKKKPKSAAGISRARLEKVRKMLKNK